MNPEYKARMNNNCTTHGNSCTMTFVESECSDGMCCFTCVIPPNNGHIGFFKSLWRKGTGSPYVKLLVMSKGYKNELYDSCKFLDFTISKASPDASLKMDLRCSIYKSRPSQCMGYPDMAGESVYHKISGPCIFNEYTASRTYKKLVYKREWQAFYAIQDRAEAMRNIFLSEDAMTARKTILKAQDTHCVTICEGKKEQDYILIPLPKQVHKVLYISEKHQPITTIRQAYDRWEAKIQKNLQNHYGSEWEIRLKDAIEMEEKDASKRDDENTTGNIEC